MQTMWWQVILMAGLLIPCVITDIKSKTLNLWWMVLMAAAGAVCNIALNSSGPADVLLGACIGGGLLILRHFVPDGIGSGDGVLILASGCILGFWGNMAFLLMGLIITALAALPAVLFFHMNKKSSLPFAPFAAAGYLLLTVLV